MKSVALEDVTFLAQNGCNEIYEVFAPGGITLIGYQGTLTLWFPEGNTAPAETLIVGSIFPTVAAAQTGPGAPSPIELQDAPDIGQPTSSTNQGGSQGSGSAATMGGMTFLTAAPKSNAVTATGGIPPAVNLVLSVMGLNFPVPQGGAIVLHADGDNANLPASGADNVELRLTLFYNEGASS